MTRPTNPNGRSRNIDKNLSTVDLSTSNNKPTSPSKNKTTPPTLRNIPENNEKIIYPSIQVKEQKNSLIGLDDDSSIVESSSGSDHEDSSIVELSSYSDQDVNESLKKTASEPTLISRPSTEQKKNGAKASAVGSIPFFEHMPEDVIRKILFEQFIDLNDINKTAKNLMHFASISKFNHEYVRVLLTEEGMREVSFEITKSVIPTLLAKLANDKKAKFTQADVDELVHNWPYLTFDSSSKENTIFTNRGLEALKKIVCHPDLREIRIINNLPEETYKNNKNYLICNNNGLELIYSLLSRESTSPLKVDFVYKNWMPQEKSKIKLQDIPLDLIKKIQKRASKCDSVIFGEIDLSRKFIDSLILFGSDMSSTSSRDYQYEFIKMMCNIGLTHSAHTISLKDLFFSGDQLILILDEIQICDKSSLQHLDLSGNRFGKAAAERLGTLLQSENTCLKTLKLNNTNMFIDEFDILAEILKTNRSLELVEIKEIIYLRKDHPIRNDKRVIITSLAQ